MTVYELKKGERAVVLQVKLPQAMKERLYGLGIRTGARIFVLKVFFRKKNYLLQCGSTQFAVRRETAKGVYVWKI